MNRFFRNLAYVLFCLSLTWFACTISTPRSPLLDCGEGYTLTRDGCISNDNVCETSCPTHQRCVNKKCVDRTDVIRKPNCATECLPGEICNNGLCIPIPCSQKCKQGEVCSAGKCVRSGECNPPCPVQGYVCLKGLCQKLCVPECDTTTQVCVQGVCEKKCEKECEANSYCRDGKCTKLEDSDQDGYPIDRDCDDKDKEKSPGLPETCNGKDSDCDGQIDNIPATPCYTGAPGTLGEGNCKAGVWACDATTKKRICKNVVIPTKEDCTDQEDNDCDGLIDNCPAEVKESKESSKEAVVEPAKEAVVEPAKEATKESTSDAGTKEMVVEPTKEAVVESTKESTSETTKESTSDAGTSDK